MTKLKNSFKGIGIGILYGITSIFLFAITTIALGLILNGPLHLLTIDILHLYNGSVNGGSLIGLKSYGGDVLFTIVDTIVGIIILGLSIKLSRYVLKRFFNVTFEKFEIPLLIIFSILGLALGIITITVSSLSIALLILYIGVFISEINRFIFTFNKKQNV